MQSLLLGLPAEAHHVPTAEQAEAFGSSARPSLWVFLLLVALALAVSYYMVKYLRDSDLE